MADVLIKNFKSDKHAKVFMDWFEGQGEQDMAAWFEEYQVKHQVVDMSKAFKKDKNGVWVMELEKE